MFKPIGQGLQTITRVLPTVGRAAISLPVLSVFAAVLIMSLVIWAFATSGPHLNTAGGHAPQSAAALLCGQSAAIDPAAGPTVLAGLGSSGVEPTSRSHVDFFTNYGRYMKRIHCMPSEAGGPDWLWIWLLVGLNAGVVLAYVRIYIFWCRSYLAEEKRDRNRKLMDLAQVFLWCAVCGYVAGMVMFVWPAYRLLALCLLILNLWSWRFACNLQLFEVSLSANRFRRLANADALTGLPNRTCVRKRIEESTKKIDPANPHAQGFAVLFLDLDHFKRINDSLGHEAGDELLRHVADRLRTQTRQGDVIESGALQENMAGRIGGDEFVIVLNDMADENVVSNVAARLVHSLSEPFELLGHLIRVTPSIGVTVVRNANRDADQILREADEAMYKAKSSGKACFRIFDQGMQVRAVEKLRLEQDLRTALEEEKLWLAFQPIVDLDQGRVSSFEALARWDHPELGVIPPNQFIPIAEETGTIHMLGEWALRSACAWLATYRQTHPDRAEVKVQINVSRRQLENWCLADQLAEVVRGQGLEPRDIVLEATETVFAFDECAMLKILKTLHDAGFILSLDDFGTGYSTLSNLHRFPITQLKIDRTFLGADHGQSQTLGLIKAISAFSQSMGIAVVSEGIEHPEQVAMLQGIGCRYAQGYYFSRPMSAAEAIDFILPSTSLGPTESQVA